MADFDGRTKDQFGEHVMHEVTETILHGLNGSTGEVMGQLQELILGGRKKGESVRNQMTQKEIEKEEKKREKEREKARKKRKKPKEHDSDSSSYFTEQSDEEE